MISGMGDWDNLVRRSEGGLTAEQAGGEDQISCCDSNWRAAMATDRVA